MVSQNAIPSRQHLDGSLPYEKNPQLDVPNWNVKLRINMSSE